MAASRIVNTPSQAIPQFGASHTQRTISNSSVLVLNHALQADTTHALVQFNNANVRITFDGNAATTTKGFLYVDGSSAYWTRKMLEAARGIRTASTDVVVEIQELNFL